MVDLPPSGCDGRELGWEVIHIFSWVGQAVENWAQFWWQSTWWPPTVARQNPWISYWCTTALPNSSVFVLCLLGFTTAPPFHSSWVYAFIATQERLPGLPHGIKTEFHCCKVPNHGRPLAPDKNLQFISGRDLFLCTLPAQGKTEMGVNSSQTNNYTTLCYWPELNSHHIHVGKTAKSIRHRRPIIVLNKATHHERPLLNIVNH